MPKYYRVLKDTPIWDEGAIVTNNQAETDRYYATEGAFMRIDGCEHDHWYESDKAVEAEENQGVFFERVHKVDLVAGKAKYLGREAAKKALKAMRAKPLDDK